MAVKKNSEKSSTTNVSERISSGLSMSTIQLFKNMENNDDVYSIVMMYFW